MKLDNGILTINQIDLDHILNIDELIENRNVPPSFVFLGCLAIELELNGINKDDVDEIRIKLR